MRPDFRRAYPASGEASEAASGAVTQGPFGVATRDVAVGEEARSELCEVSGGRKNAVVRIG